MINIKLLQKEHAAEIVKWCSNKDADFLTQWAGRGYSYPLNEEQLINRLDDGARIYEVCENDKMVGTIEIIIIDEASGTGVIGRFVIDQTLAGNGLGTKIVSQMKIFCKEQLNLAKLQLRVFDFNKGAFRCYEKNGFVETQSEVSPSGWKALTMEAKL